MASDLNQSLRAVLDTNTLLQSLPSRGRFRPIIEGLVKNLFTIILSNEILLEYEEVLKDRGGVRAWPPFRALHEAQPNKILVSPAYRWLAIPRDPDDEKFVDAAVAGDAEWIVTEDSHFDDLNLDTRLRVRPLKPKDFVDPLSGL